MKCDVEWKQKRRKRPAIPNYRRFRDKFETFRLCHHHYTRKVTKNEAFAIFWVIATNYITFTIISKSQIFEKSTQNYAGMQMKGEFLLVRSEEKVKSEAAY